MQPVAAAAPQRLRTCILGSACTCLPAWLSNKRAPCLLSAVVCGHICWPSSTGMYPCPALYHHPHLLSQALLPAAALYYSTYLVQSTNSPNSLPQLYCPIVNTQFSARVRKEGKVGKEEEKGRCPLSLHKQSDVQTPVAVYLLSLSPLQPRATNAAAWHLLTAARCCAGV